MSELWIVEFSKEQQCFHYDSLTKSIETNLSSLMESNFQCQYVPVAGPFKTLDEAADAVKELRAMFEEKGIIHNPDRRRHVRNRSAQ